MSGVGQASETAEKLCCQAKAWPTLGSVGHALGRDTRLRPMTGGIARATFLDLLDLTAPQENSAGNRHKKRCGGSSYKYPPSPNTAVGHSFDDWNHFQHR